MAFTIENRDGKTIDYDPAFVRWIAKTVEYKGDVRTEVLYPLHACNKDEFSQFYPPKTGQISDEVIKLQADGNLFCLHPELRNFEFQGSSWAGNEYKLVEILMIPCASKITIHDGSEVGGDESCEWDKQ